MGWEEGWVERERRFVGGIGTSLERERRDLWAKGTLVRERLRRKEGRLEDVDLVEVVVWRMWLW